MNANLMRRVEQLEQALGIDPGAVAEPPPKPGSLDAWIDQQFKQQTSAATTMAAAGIDAMLATAAVGVDKPLMERAASLVARDLAERLRRGEAVDPPRLCSAGPGEDGHDQAAFEALLQRIGWRGDTVQRHEVSRASTPGRGREWD